MYKMMIEEDGESFACWCRTELSKALGSPVEDALLDYLVSMRAEKDVREYLEDLLRGLKTEEVEVFMKEFFRHWCPPTSNSPPPSGSQEQLKRPGREELVLFSKQVWN